MRTRVAVEGQTNGTLAMAEAPVAKSPTCAGEPSWAATAPLPEST
jgi:hypothetical protein